jgi:hypothetical protein
MGIKDKIQQAGEKRAARAEQRSIERAELAARAEAERKEAERLRVIREKQEKADLIKRLQVEAEEFGLPFADYLAFMEYKSLEDVEPILATLKDDIDDLKSSVSTLDLHLYTIENK